MIGSSPRLSPLMAPVTPPPFNRGSSSRRYSRNASNRPALFGFPSTSTQPININIEPTTPDREFGHLLGSNLGSPFLTTTELELPAVAAAHDHPVIDLDHVDGALESVPRSFTITRPPSPVPTMNFSMVSHPGQDDYYYASLSTPPRKGLYAAHGQGSGSFYSPGSSPNNSLKTILPRLWDVLSSPGRKGKAKSKGGDTSFDFDGSSYGDLPPLDGEEGELIDDEACLIDALDVRAVTGIDILSQIPMEVALYTLVFLDLPSLLACLGVCKTWRALASDNGVWRDFFHKQDGWNINLPSGLARGWFPATRDSASEYSFSSAQCSLGGSSQLAQVMDEWARRGLNSHNGHTIMPQWGGIRYSTPSRDSLDFSVSDKPPQSDVAPLMLDWRSLYKNRMELDRRWAHEEPAVSRLSGHADSVYCLEFDSTKIITGSRDRTIKVWSILTGELLATFRGHNGSVLCLKFDKDWDVGKGAGAGGRPGFMVSGSSDCSVCVWDLKTGPGGEIEAEVKAVLKGHTGGVLDLKIDDKWIVSCSKDALIRVWDRETLQLHQTLRGHEGPVNAVGLSGNRVASASGDGKMILWDIASGEKVRTFEGHDRGLACIEFKDDIIVSGSNDCKIKVWSATTGECIRTLVGHDLLVRALSFDPPTGRLVSASYDRTVKVWDLRSGKMMREFRNSHVSHIFDVKFDVARIVSTSHDQKIVVLDFSHELEGAELFV